MTVSIFDTLLGKAWQESLLNKARKLGSAEGSQGRPTFDTEKYDIGETEVRQAVQEKLIALQTRLGKELQSIIPALAKQHSELAQTELDFENRRPIEQFSEHYEAMLNQGRQSLVHAALEKLEAEGEYNRFRHDNGITIDPDHPKDRLNYLSWVFVILVAEAVLNAVFWTTAFSGYAVKGFFVAASLAAINIFVGLAAGIALTYKNLSGDKQKIIAWTGCAVLMICAVMLNFYIIDHRAVMIQHSGVEQTSPEANWIDGRVMFGLGLLFALFAAYKGYRLFGSIPGYARASEKYLAAKAKYEKIRDDLKVEISTDASSQASLRSGVVKKIGDVQVFLSKVEGQLKELRIAYRAAIANLSQTRESVVNAYRHSNRAVRVQALESPPWFDEPVEKYSDEHEGLEQVFAEHAENTVSAKKLFQRTKDITASENSEIQSKKGACCGERFTTFINNCQLEAEEEFRRRLDAVGGQGRRT